MTAELSTHSDPTTFHLAESYFQRQKKALRFVQLIFVLLFAGMTVYFYMTLGRSGSALLGTLRFYALGLFLIMAAFLLAGAFVIAPRTFFWTTKKARDNQVVLEETGIKRMSGGQVERIGFDQLSRVTIYRVEQGKVGWVVLSSAQGTILLGGLEGMEELTAGIIARLPDPSIVHTRPPYLNRLAIAGYAAFLIILVLLWSGTTWFYGLQSGMVLVMLSGMAASIVRLITRPTTRSLGKAFGRFELVSTVLPMLSSLAVLALYLPAVWQHPCSILGRHVFQSGCLRDYDYVSPAIHYLESGPAIVDDRLGNLTVRYQPNLPWGQRARLPHEEYVSRYALSDDGNFLVSLTIEFDNLAAREADGRLSVWEAPSRSLLAQYPVAGESAFALQDIAFMPGSHTLLLEYDGRIELRNAPTWELLQTLPALRFNAFAAGGRLAAGYIGGYTIQLWETGNGREIGRLAIPEETFGFVQSLAFSPDGQFLAANIRQGDVVIWEIATGEIRHWWHEAAESGGQIAFSPDGRLLAAGFHERFSDGYVRLWLVSEGTTWATIDLDSGFGSDRPEALSFSPDGEQLAVTTSEEVMLFALDRLGD